MPITPEDIKVQIFHKLEETSTRELLPASEVNDFLLDLVLLLGELEDVLVGV